MSISTNTLYRPDCRGVFFDMAKKNGSVPKRDTRPKPRQARPVGGVLDPTSDAAILSDVRNRRALRALSLGITF